MPEHTRFIYYLQPTRLEMLSQGSTADESRIIDAHFNYLADLTAKGVILMAGRTLNEDATTFGIVLLETTSEGSARQVMQADPAVYHGVMRAELYPFRVSLCTNTIGEG